MAYLMTFAMLTSITAQPIPLSPGVALFYSSGNSQLAFFTVASILDDFPYAAYVVAAQVFGTTDIWVTTNTTLLPGPDADPSLCQWHAGSAGGLAAILISNSSQTLVSDPSCYSRVAALPGSSLTLTIAVRGTSAALASSAYEVLAIPSPIISTGKLVHDWRDSSWLLGAAALTNLAFSAKGIKGRGMLIRLARSSGVSHLADSTLISLTPQVLIFIQSPRS
jgi:hypothetical protein